MLGQQTIQRASQDLLGRVAEDALTGGVEGLDVPPLVHRDDGVLDVIENDLELRGRLLANFAGERLRLIRHDLHGTHHTAPLGVDAIVVRADFPQQSAQVEVAVTPARVGDAAAAG